MSSNDETSNKEQETPKRVSWPARLKVSILSETMKNWAALLMGVAALMTALSSYKGTVFTSTSSTELGYESLRLEIKSLNKDISTLNGNVNYLYRLRELEEHKRKVVEELQHTNDSVEDTYLQKYLTQKFGAKYAADYMLRRQKAREEISREYNIYPEGGLHITPLRIQEEHIVPSFNELKNLKK